MYYTMGNFSNGRSNVYSETGLTGVGRAEFLIHLNTSVHLSVLTDSVNSYYIVV